MKNNKTTVALYSIAGIILSIPLFAMFFTDEVNWTFLDFVAAGFLLFTTATVIDRIVRWKSSARTRFVLIGFTLLILFLIWVELAVGIFGSPIAGS